MSAINQENIMNFCSFTGCEPSIARQYLQAAGGNVQVAVEQYFSNPTKFSGVPQQDPQSAMPSNSDAELARALQASMQPQIPGVSGDDYEAQMNQAIMDSIKQQDQGNIHSSYEPLDPSQRKREEGVPCGIKNIGNTCYLNSLLQSYYNLPNFVRAIMEFVDDGKPIIPKPEGANGQGQAQQAVSSNNLQDAEEKLLVKRLESARKLIKNLKILFANMAKGDKKYADPAAVAGSLTDDSGNGFQVGEERDIGEFNDCLLSRVQEGLNYKQIYQDFVRQQRTKMLEEKKMQEDADSAQAPVALQKQESSILETKEASNKDDSLMVGEEAKANEVKVTVEGKNYIGKDVISQDFMSRIRQVQMYTDEKGQITEKQKVQDSFAATLIRVIGFKEVYEAWESQCRSAVEGLELSKTKSFTGDQIVTAMKEDKKADMAQVDWIEKVPRVLCLQLNRLDFKDGHLVKHKHRVAMEKKIFVDRFLYMNARKSEEISRNVAVLREQIKHLEASINEFKNFGGSDYDIREMLNLVADFFSMQDASDKLKGVPQNAHSDCKHPFKAQVAAADKPKAADAVALMQKYQKQLSTQVQDMERKIEEKQKQITAAFGIPEMQKYPYHLHSICVHDGGAESGHYFAYIYDRHANQWRKYNDIRVTDVTEEEVFKQAEGGDSWATAYWVVYVQDDIAKNLDHSNINYYQVPEKDPTRDFSKHCYGSMIPSDVEQIVAAENAALAKEIDDQRNNKFFQELKSIYVSRWKAYKDNFLSGSSSDKTINLKCLAHHLYAKNEANILKKVLLAECYQQVVAKDEFKDMFDLTIDKLPANSTLLKAMQDGSRGNVDFPDQFILSQDERQKLANIQTEYIREYIFSFVLMKECDALKYLPYPVDKSRKDRPPFTEEADILASSRADEAFFIAYHSYCSSGKVFNEGAGQKIRDLMKCLSLFQLVTLRAFMKHCVSIVSTDKFDAGKAAKFILDKLQKLKFVTAEMLLTDDLHVDQFLLGLQSASDLGQEVLKKCEIAEDYKKIMDSIENKETRQKPLALDQLSVFARGCLEDFSVEGAYRKHINKDFLEVMEMLQQRPAELWLKYELFEKTFVKETATPQDAPAGSGAPADVEMKPVDGEDSRVYINLQQLHDKNFEIAAAILKPVIHNLHAVCIRGKSAKDLVDDKALDKFCASTYGI